MLRRLAVALGLAAAAGPSTPPAPVSPQVLLVVGAGATRPGDDLLRRRLELRGYGVSIITDGALTEATGAGVALVGLLALCSTSAIAQPAERRPLWELYSWRSTSVGPEAGEVWEFSILSGASSSIKRPSEVFDPAGIIKGLDELEKSVDRMPPNSDVIWIESVRVMKKEGKDYVRGDVVKGMERLALPSSVTMDRVRVMVRSRGMHFVGVTGGDHTSVEE